MNLRETEAALAAAGPTVVRIESWQYGNPVRQTRLLVAAARHEGVPAIVVPVDVLAGLLRIVDSERLPVD